MKLSVIKTCRPFALAFIITLLNGVALPCVTPFGQTAYASYHAVIVGVSDYDGLWHDLDYCDDDAQAVYDALLKSVHWQAANMTLLLNADATEANIQAAIANMAARATADDVCLFYFAGHGSFITDTAPLDETDQKDELLCPYYIDTNYILDDELSDWLGALPTDKIIIWLDTCYSGGNIRSSVGKPRCVRCDTQEVLKDDGFIADLKKKSRDIGDLTAPFCAAASDADELAFEDADLQHGVFTYYLIESLESLNTDTNGNGWVSGEESFTYLYSRVVNFSPSQHPQMYDAFPGEADVVTAGTTVPLCEALDNCDFVFTLSGDAAWNGQTDVTYDGIDAIQSGITDDDETAVSETTVTGPVCIKFWWKVSSEEDYDFLSFYVDNAIESSISGEVDWQQGMFSIPSGDHLLQWKYSKDFDTSEGSDCGWLDQVETSVWPKGDLNDDCQVNLVDAIIGLQVITGQNPAQLRNDYVSSDVDVNGDDKVGLEEPTYSLEKAAGMR